MGPGWCSGLSFYEAFRRVGFETNPSLVRSCWLDLAVSCSANQWIWIFSWGSWLSPKLTLLVLYSEPNCLRNWHRGIALVRVNVFHSLGNQPSGPMWDDLIESTCCYALLKCKQGNESWFCDFPRNYKKLIAGAKSNFPANILQLRILCILNAERRCRDFPMTLCPTSSQNFSWAFSCWPKVSVKLTAAEVRLWLF